MRFLGMRQIVVEEFNKMYYDSIVWGRGATRWLGTPIQKCPTDLWIYQEIIFELRPDVVIETGTADGGSALFFASLFDLIGKGRIITIDVQDVKERPKHDRITYLLGSSTAKEIVEQVKKTRKSVV